MLKRLKSIIEMYLWIAEDLNWFGKCVFTPLFVAISPIIFLIALGTKKDVI
jgi:hypothetical protein